MSPETDWFCLSCNALNEIDQALLHVGGGLLTPDQLEEMDPEDIEAWQDANEPVQCCSRCGTQKGS